jgi:murein L,D-transpeptidase YafK
VNARLFIVAAALTVMLTAPVAFGSPSADMVPLQRPAGAVKADRVLVEKAERRLTLLLNGKAIARYPIALGRNPVGPKVFQGDGRTPEGLYAISARNTASRFYRSLRINYPQRDNRALAAEYGISPGGDIMIHGQPNRPGPRTMKDWTEGCIAVSNQHMDEIWTAVDLGTPVEIRP